MKAYLSSTFGDAELLPDTMLFRNRSRAAYREDTLADDFAAVAIRSLTGMPFRPSSSAVRNHRNAVWLASESCPQCIGFRT